MKERLLNIAENRLLVVFLVIIMLTVSQFAYAGDPIPTCASCGAVNPKAASDHNPRCPYGPKSSSGSSSGGFSVPSGTNPAQAMALGIIGLFLNEALSPSPDTSAQDEIARQNAIKRQQEDEQKTQAAIQRYYDLQSEDAVKKQMDQNAKIKQGAEVLSKTKIVGSGGELKPFSFGNPKLDLKPIGQTYPAPSTAWEQMLCAAYFSNMAKQAKSEVDARFYADQAQRVMVGEPTYVECKIPKVSNEKLAKRMKEVEKIYAEMNVKIKNLQDIEAKLTETREKIKDAEIKKEEATAKLTEIQNRTATEKPEEKAEVDDRCDLGCQAHRELQNAEQELNQAKESERDDLAKKEQLEKELENMKSQMQAKIQAGDK